MGKLDTQSTVTLIINGEQSKTTLKEVSGAVNELRAQLNNMRKEDNPGVYEEKIKKLGELRNAQSAMREEIGKGAAETRSFFSDFEKGFEEVKRIAEGVTIGTIISSGIRGALEGIREFFSEAQQKFEDYEKTQAQLQAVLKSTGGVAGVTGKQLEEYQKRLSEQDAVTESVVAKGEEMLLTFTNIRGAIYEKALPAIIDMTAAFHGGKVTMEGVQETSIQVGKALNDPINGMTSLRRVGVLFTEAQKEQITTMQKSGDLMGAQSVILKELQTEFGGTAAAIRNTSAGQLQAFNVDMDKLEEKVGGIMVKVKGYFAGVYDQLIQTLSETRSKSERLTDEFKDQTQKVNGLTKETEPLINRYTQLKEKGSLNKTEQSELKTVIAQLADTIPSAVTQWDKYGNALGINTAKAQEFIKVQKALLGYKNKEAIEATTSERDDLIARQKQLLISLNAGEVSSSGGGMASGTMRKLSDDEIKDMRTQLKTLNDDIVNKNALLKGLTGSFMDDVAKEGKTVVAAVKKLSDMTVGELQDRLSALNQSLKATTVNSAAYKKIIKDINDTEKLLNQEKDDKNGGKHAESEREKQAKELQQYQNQLRQVRDQIDQLIGGATKGTIAGLDQQLKIINDKYQALIAKLQELNKNKNATSADKAANNKQISQLQTSDTADQLLATNEADFKNDSSVLKNEYSGKKDAVKDDYAKGLISKKTYDDQLYKLEQEELEKEYMLRVTYGQSTQAIENTMANNEVANKKKIADAAIAYLRLERKENEDFFRAKQGIAAAEQDLATSGFNVLNDLFGKNKALMLAELALEKVIAIGKIEAAEGVEIAKYWAAYGVTAPYLAIALSGMAVTRANLSIAGIIVEGIGQAIGDMSTGSSNKMANGGVIDGPDHSAGGVPLINGHTGKQMAEVEGGETIAVFSKETTANNKMLINQLLYNGQHRNGAPVTINTGMAVKAMEHYRTGGIIPGFGNSSASSSGQSAGAGSDRLARIEAALENQMRINERQAAINEIPVTFNNRAYDIQKAKNVQIQNNANA